jgi:hypothetical protein
VFIRRFNLFASLLLCVFALIEAWTRGAFISPSTNARRHKLIASQTPKTLYNAARWYSAVFALIPSSAPISFIPFPSHIPSSTCPRRFAFTVAAGYNNPPVFICG